MKRFIYKSRGFASLDNYNGISGFNHFMRGLYFLAGFFFLVSSCFAQSGGSAGQLMSYGVGARAMGMGGAFFAVADDSTAAYWNPAALVFLKRKEFSTMQSSMFADTSLSFFTYAYPTTTKGTLAISMTQLKSVGFEKISIEANAAGDEIISIKKLGNFDSSESALALSWGRYVSETLSFGFMFKNITRSLDTSADGFRAIDIAMLQKFSRTYRMAIGVQNVFSMKSGDTDDQLPLTFKFGQALSLFKGSLVFGLDFTKPQQADMGWRFGGEYWLLSWAALRFGVMGSPAIQEADLGVGIRYGSLSFDLAQGIHALGTATRFSLTMRMGQSNRAKHDREVRILVRQAMAYFKAGYFSKAVAKLKAALDAAPGNAQVKRMLYRLEAAVEYVPGATGG
ncbi:MAG: PorV/PorQ family protein, partial [Elusimicrobiales bacterium]|nr:PorV/PorQ family protein [Elusimicrobiales bacterium]